MNKGLIYLLLGGAAYYLWWQNQQQSAAPGGQLPSDGGGILNLASGLLPSSGPLGSNTGPEWTPPATVVGGQVVAGPAPPPAPNLTAQVSSAFASLFGAAALAANQDFIAGAVENIHNGIMTLDQGKAWWVAHEDQLHLSPPGLATLAGLAAATNAFTSLFGSAAAAANQDFIHGGAQNLDRGLMTVDQAKQWWLDHKDLLHLGASASTGPTLPTSGPTFGDYNGFGRPVGSRLASLLGNEVGPVTQTAVNGWKRYWLAPADWAKVNDPNEGESFVLRGAWLVNVAFGPYPVVTDKATITTPEGTFDITALFSAGGVPYALWIVPPWTYRLHVEGRALPTVAGGAFTRFTDDTVWSPPAPRSNPLWAAAPGQSLPVVRQDEVWSDSQGNAYRGITDYAHDAGPWYVEQDFTSPTIKSSHFWALNAWKF